MNKREQKEEANRHIHTHNQETQDIRRHQGLHMTATTVRKKEGK